MYTLNYDQVGRVAGATRSLDDGTQRCFVVGTQEWKEFLAWNSDPKNPAPLTIADRAPPSDEELAAAQKASAKEQLASQAPAAVAVIAQMRVLLDALNECRTALTLKPLTWKEVPAAAEAKLDAADAVKV